MGKVLIDHSMSLDGFSTGPNVGVLSIRWETAGSSCPCRSPRAAERGVCDEFWGSARSVEHRCPRSKRPSTEEAR